MAATLVRRFVASILIVLACEALVVVAELRSLAPAARALMRGLDDPRLTWTAALGLRAGLVALAGVAVLSLGIPVAAATRAFAHTAADAAREMRAACGLERMGEGRRRDRFMADVAHDLRAPLAAVSGMAHALRDGMVRDASTRDEYLQSMCHNTDRLTDLVNTLFEYAKLAGDSLEPNMEDVDLPELLLREAAAAYAAIEGAGMRLTVHVIEKQCVVRADRTQLARVVANLLSNAVRHNGAGTEVALMLICISGVAYVVVADTGDPIQADPQELFLPFVRGDASRSLEGSGLGLSICRRIAELHGFALNVAQPYGRFTKAFVLQCRAEARPTGRRVTTRAAGGRWAARSA